MKRKLILILITILVSTFIAIPAYAIKMNAVITADCDGYEITVDGATWIIYTADYSFTINSNGDQVIVSGNFEINPVGDYPLNYPHIVVSGSWDDEFCGPVSINGVVDITTDVPPPDNPTSPYYNGYPSFTFTYSVELYCECEEEDGPGTGTPGYWMNHPDAWPVPNIVIGCINYTKEEAISIMKDPVKGDKTYTMFPALVAAVLNVLVGNDSSCIDNTIAEADSWMAANPVGSGVEGSSAAWEEGEPLYWMLDDYNNGLLCAPSRDAMEEEEEEYLSKKAIAGPSEFSLQQNNPNPFNPVTTISFTIPRTSIVTIRVYNVLGKEVATLVDGLFSTGQHSVEWNASEFGSGIYFYSIETYGFTQTKKMLLLK
jgi:hypothetical protein